MPKVSEEHLERRRQQILGAATECFARKGFHATSMQDVFAESGLSAGAVYRYFKSKDELITAIAEDSLEIVWPVFEEMLKEDPVPPLDETVARFAALIIEGDHPSTRIAPQAWAAAAYDPKIAAHATEFMVRVRGWWIELVKRERDAGRLPADCDPEAVGTVLWGLIPGIILQHLLLGDANTETFRRGIRDMLRLPVGEENSPAA